MALTKDDFIEQIYRGMSDFELSTNTLIKALNKKKVDYEEDVRTKISNILIEHNRVTGRRITEINPSWEETCSGDKLVYTKIIAEPVTPTSCCPCSPL